MHGKLGMLLSGWSPAVVASRCRALWAVRRVRRWTFAVAGIVVAWGVLAGLALPPLLRGVLEDQLSERLRVRCTVEAVRFNPYSWALSIEGVRVPSPTGEGDLLTFDALQFSPGLSAALRFAPVLAYVRLVNPVVYVAYLGDGRYSFSDLIPQGEEPAPATPEAAQKPLFPFAASDFEVANGTLIFQDVPRKSIHVVSELQFVVPFTSTMQRDRERAITPSLNATVDGRPLSVEGRLLPFADTLRTEFDVVTDEVELTQYREYLAAFTPLRVESGRVGAGLKLVVEQSASHDVELGLAGALMVNDLVVKTPDGGATALALKTGTVAVERFSWLDRRAEVGRADFDGLQARAVRMADGRLDWQTFFRTAPDGGGAATQGANGVAAANGGKKPAGDASGDVSGAASGAGRNATASPQAGGQPGAPGAGAPEAAGGAAARKPATPAEQPFVVTVRELALRDTALTWKDETVPGGAEVRLHDMDVTLSDFSTPGAGGPGAKGTAATGGGAFEASLRMAGGPGKAQPGGTDKAQPGVLKAEGTLTLDPLRVSLRLDARDLPLTPVRGYVAQASPLLSLDAGTAGAQGEVDLSLATADSPALVVRKGALQVAGLALSLAGQKQPSVALAGLEVADVAVDLAARTLATGPVTLTRPDLRVVRGKDGAIDLAALASGGGAASPAPAADKGAATPPNKVKDRANDRAKGRSAGGAASSAAVAEAPWQVGVAALRVEDGRVTFEDRQPAEPAMLVLEGVRLATGAVSSQGGKPLDVDFLARWQKQGSISVKGSGVAQPLALTLDTRLSRVDLRPLDPYLGEATDLLFGGGEVTTDLRIALREEPAPRGAARRGTAEPGLGLSVEGTARLDNLSLKLAGGKHELASLRRFAVRGLRFEQHPSGSLALRVKDAELDAPRLSMLVFKDGSNSLGRAAGGKAGGATGSGAAPGKAAAAATDAGSPSRAADTAHTGAATPDGNREGHGAASAPEAAQPAARSAAGPFTTLEVESLRLNGGSLRFRDERMSPAFALEMSDMEARVSGVSLNPESRAEVQFRAGIEGVPVLAGGTVNPFVHPVFADMRFTMSGLDLVPLSPYAVQYIAYPVEHGRLSADVTVKADNWVLDANNHFTLSQIELGDKDARPGAPNYPLKLGLALLQDMSGNVDLQLPVKGRLDDPQFRLGGVIMQAVANLMVKVVTSPFALVGSVLSLGSGGRDMRYVEFAPGVATLDEAAEKSLRGVVDVLRQRPRLKLEVQGVAEPGADTRGLKEQAMLRMMREAKHASLSRAERARVNVDDVTIGKDEYEDLLEEVYKDAPFDKPRNVVGFTRSQPVEVMEAALREHHEVTPEALKELAAARAKAVRDMLLQLEPTFGERVFLSGAKVAPAAGGEGDAAKGGGSRVNLGLQ